MVVITITKESEITTIRIPKNVKKELNDVANEKEPYHATISRLIKENQQLKETNNNYAKMISIYEQNEKRLNEIMDKQYEKLEVLAKISERLEKLENED